MAEDAGSIYAEVRIRLDKLQSDIAQTTARVDGLERDVTSATASIEKKATANFKAMGLAAVAASTLIISSFRALITSTAQYSQALSDVQAATRGTVQDLAKLESAAASAGDELATSTTDALGAVEALAKAGVSTADIMGGALPGALTLAAAGSMNVADAAEIAAATMTQFGLSGQDVTHIADLLAAGAGKAQGEVSDLSMALKQSGLVAAQTGLKIEDTVGALAAFASAGLLGSDAGTSFRTMLLRLTPQSKEAADEMKRLGITAFDANGEFIGLSKYAQLLKDKLSGLTTEQRNSALATVFGSDSIRAANILYTQGAKGIDEWKNKVNDAGYAADVAKIKLDNLNGDLKALGASTTDTASKIGDGLNPVLRGSVQFLTFVLDLVGKIPAYVTSFAVGAGVLSAALIGVNAGLGLMGITLTALTGPIGLVVLGISALTAGSIAAGAAIGEMNLKEARIEFESLGRASGIATSDMDEFVLRAKATKDQLKDITEFDKDFGADDFKKAAENAGLTNSQLASIVLKLGNIPAHVRAVAQGFRDSKLESELFLAQQQATWKAMDDYWGKKYPEAQKKAAKTTVTTTTEIVDKVDEAWATQTALMQEFYDRDAEALAQSEQDAKDSWALQTALMDEFYTRDAEAIAQKEKDEADAWETQTALMQEFYDRDEAERKKQEEDAIRLANSILDSFSGLMSALGNLFANLYSQQIDALDAQYAHEKELVENNGLTKKQALEKNLTDAQTTGDAQAISDAQRALDLFNLEADFERKKAKIQYEAAMASWEIQVALTAAQAAQAALNAFSSVALVPIVGPALAGPVAAAVAGGIGALSVAAVIAAKPQAPAFATGGIVLPSGQQGKQVTVADQGGGELMFGTGALGQPLMQGFADLVASKVSASSGGATVVIPVYLDGKVIAQSTAKLIDNGVVKMQSVVK